MSIDYSNAKTSFHVEEQLPSFVRNNGQNFINFLKAYYEWLEKRFIICYLKSEKDFNKSEIIGQTLTLSADHFLLTSEDDLFVLTPESHNLLYEVQDLYSILFNGTTNYGDVNHQLIDLTTDWTISLWLKPTATPSYVLSDFDVVTLSNSSYISALKIRKLDDNFGFNFLGQEINTKISARIEQWQYVTITYNSSTYTITFNVFNDLGLYTFSHSIDLSTCISNRLVIGCDLYNSRNFYTGFVDEIASWNIVLTDDELVDTYNSGNPINLAARYAPAAFDSQAYMFDDLLGSFDETGLTNTTITNYFRFEDSNTYNVLNEVAVFDYNAGLLRQPSRFDSSNTSFDSATISFDFVDSGGDYILDANNNLQLYHTPTYSIDVPQNVIAIISENEIAKSLALKVVSGIKFNNVPDGLIANRMLAFCEHQKGMIETDQIVFTTNEFVDIFIDSYQDAKNPLSIINNLENYQEIDYSLDFNNFVYDAFYRNLWTEIMNGFPQYLDITFDQSIKNIIAKNIKDFYKTKGTFESFKYLFKILYNEDIEIGTDIYSDSTFSYVLNTRNANTAHVLDYVKKIIHPVGYNIELNLKV